MLFAVSLRLNEAFCFLLIYSITFVIILSWFSIVLKDDIYWENTFGVAVPLDGVLFFDPSCDFLDTCSVDCVCGCWFYPNYP